MITARFLKSPLGKPVKHLTVNKEYRVLEMNYRDGKGWVMVANDEGIAQAYTINSFHVKKIYTRGPNRMKSWKKIMKEEE